MRNASTDTLNAGKMKQHLQKWLLGVQGGMKKYAPGQPTSQQSASKLIEAFQEVRIVKDHIYLVIIMTKNTKTHTGSRSRGSETWAGKIELIKKVVVQEYNHTHLHDAMKDCGREWLLDYWWSQLSCQWACTHKSFHTIPIHSFPFYYLHHLHDHSHHHSLIVAEWKKSVYTEGWEKVIIAEKGLG